MLAGEGGRRQVLRRRAGSDGVGGLLAEPCERVGDRRREIVGDGDPFDGLADLRAERADRLPVIRVAARQPIQLIVDRRRFRHDPPEGVRRHAKASRHADAFDPRQPAQVRALTANDRDLHLVNLLQTQHVLLDHFDTSGAPVRRRTTLDDRVTGACSSVEPLVGHVLSSGRVPSDESAGRAQSGGAQTRTCAPSARNRTASSITGSASPRFPYIDNNTRTSRPHLRRLWPRPTILRHDPGLAASPPVRYTLRVARRE